MKPNCEKPKCQAEGFPLEVNVGADGKFKVILETTDTFAGDNYIVEGSFDPTFPCAPVGGADTCAKTAVITAWKRVYYEAARMFKKGSFILDDASNSAGEFMVLDRSPFQIGQSVRFIHAPSNPRSPGSGPSDYWVDDAIISQVQPGAGKTGQLVLQQPLSHAYLGQPTPSGNADPVLNSGDFVGLVTGKPNKDYFAVNLDYIREAFAAAFVDYEPSPVRIEPSGSCPKVSGVLTCMTELPFVKQLVDDNNLADDQSKILSLRWFESQGQLNHQFVFGVRDSTNCAMEHHIGNTVAVEGWARSYLCVPDFPGNPVLGEMTGHEISHQWHVDAGGYPNATGEHDPFSEYDDASKLCIMHDTFDPNSLPLPPYLTDGKIVFHYQNGKTGVDSEYRWIRERCEPIPYDYPLLPVQWWSHGPQPCR